MSHRDASSQRLMYIFLMMLPLLKYIHSFLTIPIVRLHTTTNVDELPAAHWPPTLGRRWCSNYYTGGPERCGTLQFFGRNWRQRFEVRSKCRIRVSPCTGLDEETRLNPSNRVGLSFWGHQWFNFGHASLRIIYDQSFMTLDIYELRGLHFLSSAGVLMERIGRANVSNQPSIQLTLANLTIPRFAKKSLGDGKVQSIAWILRGFFRGHFLGGSFAVRWDLLLVNLDLGVPKCNHRRPGC